MNKRDEAILKWLRVNRPDVVDTFMQVERAGQSKQGAQAVYVFMAIAFEAGREFQYENPTIELDNPAIYLQQHVS